MSGLLHVSDFDVGEQKSTQMQEYMRIKDYYRQGDDPPAPSWLYSANRKSSLWSILCRQLPTILM